MKKGTFSRKMDPMGRLIIPSKLRERLGMKIGEEYDIDALLMNGHQYLIVDCGPIPSEEDSIRSFLQNYTPNLVENDD